MARSAGGSSPSNTLCGRSRRTNAGEVQSCDERNQDDLKSDLHATAGRGIMGHAPAKDHLRRNALLWPPDLLIYCADHRCSHSIAMSADRWSDDVKLSDIEPRFVCKACGKRGADVRPHFEPAQMGTAN